MDTYQEKLTEALVRGESLLEGGRLKLQQEVASFSLSPMGREETENVSLLLGRRPDKIYTEFETIHGNSITLNYTYYPNSSLLGDGVRTGYMSFLTPYPKPLIKNHDIYEEPLGRAYKASYEEIGGIGCPIVIYEVTDPEAITKILNGSYLTSSIGAHTDEFRCSVCGANWLDKDEFLECAWEKGHERGKMYEGKLMYLVTGNFENVENSIVNSPADQKAGIRRPSIEIGLGEEMYRLGDKNLTKRLTTMSVLVDGLKENTHMDKPTYGELFGLPEDHEKFGEEGPWTTEELAELDESDFAFPERRFPLVNAELAEEMTSVTTWAVDTTDETTTDEEVVETQEVTEDIEGSEEEEIVVSEETTESESDEEAIDWEAQVTELTEKVAELTEELTEAEATAADYREKTISLMATLQVRLGEAKNVEDAVVKMSSRTKESIDDSFEDLLERAANQSVAVLKPEPSKVGREELYEMVASRSSMSTSPAAGNSDLENSLIAEESEIEVIVEDDDEEIVLTQTEDGKVLVACGIPAGALALLDEK